MIKRNFGAVVKYWSLEFLNTLMFQIEPCLENLCHHSYFQMPFCFLTLEKNNILIIILAAWIVPPKTF